MAEIEKKAVEQDGAAAGGQAASVADATHRRSVDRDIMRSLPGTHAMYGMIAGAIIAYALSLVGTAIDSDLLFRGGNMGCFSLLIIGGLTYFHSYTTAKRLTRERRAEQGARR